MSDSGLENGRLYSDHVRLYNSVRAVHLERAYELDPAAIVYRTRNYEFDESTSSDLEVVQASAFAAARLIMRSDVTVLEINEPLFLQSLPRTALVLAALRIRDPFRRRHPRIVTYAIENLDPFSNLSGVKVRTRIRRFFEHMLANAVWRRVDRVAFGTDAARDLYGARLRASDRRVETTMDALPAPCACSRAATTPKSGVVFVGAFSARKGFGALLDAWPSVVELEPTARVTLIGEGELMARAEEFAASTDSAELLTAPAHDEIHRRLRDATVLVLASQRTPRWREQVGQPIGDGLSHGCRIVATSETGLASWLSAHGHAVLDPASTPDRLARAIVEQLQHGEPAASIVETLPPEDGRLAADRWLFAASVPVDSSRFAASEVTR